MKTTQFINLKSERGFTLVELAIVMIIIGLLIGGILKGQELIANAQVGATVAQIKAIDAATTTFKDKYNAVPGDMINASTRLPTRCGAGGAGACTNGDGNGRLATAPFAAPAGEATQFFPQLAAADLISSISQSGAAGWGNIYPDAKIGGGFHPGYTAGGALLGANANPSSGHYLSLVSTAGAAGANDALTPNQAARIDTKLDDGIGRTGIVFAGNAACAAGANGIYAESSQGKICDIAIRFQN